MKKHSCLVVDENKTTLMTVIEDDDGEFHQSVRLTDIQTATFRVNYCPLCGDKAPCSIASIQSN